MSLSRNYAICVGAFIAAFALVWWLVDARGYVLPSHYWYFLRWEDTDPLCSKYTGPRTNDYIQVAASEALSRDYGALDQFDEE